MDWFLYDRDLLHESVNSFLLLHSLENTPQFRLRMVTLDERFETSRYQGPGPRCLL